MFGKSKAVETASPISADTARLLEFNNSSFNREQLTTIVGKINSAINAAPFEDDRKAFFNGMVTQSYATVQLEGVTEATVEVAAYEYKRLGYTVLYFRTGVRQYTVLLTWDKRVQLQVSPVVNEAQFGASQAAKRAVPDRQEVQLPGKDEHEFSALCPTVGEGMSVSGDKERENMPHEVSNAEAQHAQLNQRLFDCTDVVSVYDNGRFIAIAPTYITSLFELGVDLSGPKGWSCAKLCQYLAGYCAVLDAVREKHNYKGDRLKWCQIPVGRLPAATVTAARKKFSAVDGVTFDQPMDNYIQLRYEVDAATLLGLADSALTYQDIQEAVSLCTVVSK